MSAAAHEGGSVIGRVLAGGLAIGLLGCAEAALSTRPVQQDGVLTVRLDSYRDPTKNPDETFDHPMDWAEPDLRAILGRLLLEQQVGILQKAPPPVPVFTQEEIARLTPALRKAFQSARPSEWIAFVLRGSDGATPTMTSGGFFVRETQLHVLLANHRDPVAQGDDAKDIEANPLRPLKRRGRALTFDGRPYMVSEQENWMGGHGSPPSSELVVDYRGFLASLRPVEVPVPAPPPPTEGGEAGAAEELRGQVSKLKDDVDRLKRQLDAQAEELARLREQAKGRQPAPKKPAP
jgi:hypothetical protein